jgi:hypothetical protein
MATQPSNEKTALKEKPWRERGLAWFDDTVIQPNWNSGFKKSFETPPIPTGFANYTYKLDIDLSSNSSSETVIYPNQIQYGPLTAGKEFSWTTKIGERSLIGTDINIINPGFTLTYGYSLDIGKTKADLTMGVKCEIRKDNMLRGLVLAGIALLAFLAYLGFTIPTTSGIPVFP